MNKWYSFYGLLLGGLCLLSGALFAQNNLVLTSPAAANPGGGNVLVGINAGNTGMTNLYNTVTGYYAGNSLSSGRGNSFYGTSAGRNSTATTDNAFFGLNAGFNNTGDQNTFMGSQAGFSNTTGYKSTFLGYQAGYSNTSGINNTFLGYQAGYSTTTGSQNLFVGHWAGKNNTQGIQNVFIGLHAGGFNTTGISNTFVGQFAGELNTSGNNNAFVGIDAGQSSTGDSNAFFGASAGESNGEGSQNTFIGMNTGNSPNTITLQNATALGYGTKVSTSNSLILGNNANVGIGNTAPANKLEITQGTAGNSGLRLTNLTSASPATVLNQHKFLTVNASGDVILGSTTSSSARVAADFWQASGDYLQNVNPSGVIIGQGVEKTPAGYSLFVGQGLLAEKVKVAVKNTSDWSDKVFESGYSLKALSEVESYIKAHKHLPGVASAAEVVEQGVDVAKMDAKLLEKIEELTLYSIQLEKAVQTEKQARQQQQVELDELKKLVKQLAEKK